MIFNNYLIIKIPVMEKNFDFYEIEIEAGGDFSAAWCEIYFPSQALTEFYNALNEYAKNYDKPLDYDLDETVSMRFSPHSRTGVIEIDIHMNKRNGDFGDGYSEITIWTNITDMDGFVNGIGKMLNRNSSKAFLGSEQGRFIR
jgi:hypothetical protein